MRRALWMAGVVVLAGMGGLLAHDPAPIEPAPVRAAPHVEPGGPAAPDPRPAPADPEAVQPTGPEPVQPMGRLLDPTGMPVAGALVYRSQAVLGSVANTWQEHWEDRNRTQVVSDGTGSFAIPIGTGPLHVRAAGFSPASYPVPEGDATWVLAPRPDMWAIAHRGGASHAPENTLAAIHTAALMGAPYVEVDVRLTREHDPVVIHDPTLDRTTNGTGPVALSSLWQVQLFDAGSWFHESYAGERVPSLLQALQVVKAHDIGVVIELKMERAEPGPHPTDVPTDAMVYPAVLDAVNQANVSMEQTVISSFGHTSSHTCARITAGTCGWIVRRNETDMASASAALASLNVVHLHREDANEHIVAEIQGACDRLDVRSQCPRVIAYTVNKVPDMQRLAAYVDGITSDDVEALMAALAEPA